MNQPPQPPMWYWTSRGIDVNPNPTAKHLVDGIDKAGDEFEDKLDTMQGAMGMHRQTDPRKRLRAYLDKPLTVLDAQAQFQEGLIPVIYSWESQAQYFPKDYEEDQDDFMKLRQRALAGDFGPEFQIEVQYYERGLDELGL